MISYQGTNLYEARCVIHRRTFQSAVLRLVAANSRSDTFFSTMIVPSCESQFVTDPDGLSLVVLRSSLLGSGSLGCWILA
jgi:hypothetical protein